MISEQISQSLISLKNQQINSVLLDSQKDNANNISSFKDLYAGALNGHSISQLSRLMMLGSTLGLGDDDGFISQSGISSSIASHMLRAAVQQMQGGSAQPENFAAYPARQTDVSNTQAPQNPETASTPQIANPSAITAETQAEAEQPGKYDSLIKDAAERHGVDPNLVKAVVTAESSFDPSVVSNAGAQGLMQLMPGTAEDLGVNDPFDPAQNIEGGTKYLSWMLNRFDGDVNKALAAYNWGPGNVERGGRYPSETRNYLKKVGSYREMYAQGFSASA
jgi:soluble lytic murein transglycosylase-like protein